MLNRGRLAAAAGALFVALAVWPAHAADWDGDIPQAVPCSADVRVVTAVLTRVSVANRIVSVEMFPRETAVSLGGGVVWLNTIPGAVVQVLFETAPAAAGDSMTMSPLPARSYASTFMEHGKASLLCFPASGTFPYHVVIATPDSEVALHGVVVVGQ